MNTDTQRLNELITEFRHWLNVNQLPHHSADELLVHADVKPEQREWLSDFIKRWDRAAHPNDHDTGETNE